MTQANSLSTLDKLDVSGEHYQYHSLKRAAASLSGIEQLPKSLKVLLENLLRNEDGETVTLDDIRAVSQWLEQRRSDREIQYRPARVLMQDFTGVPAVVDLAAMRDAVARAGGDPEQINPLSPVDLVIDHSVMVDRFASDSAFHDNVEIEMQRNGERYAFLRWGQRPFRTFAWCRRAPAFVTRSIWSTWPRPFGPPRWTVSSGPGLIPWSALTRTPP